MSYYENPVSFSHKIIKDYVKDGDFVIDATCGNGNDTLFLSGLVGETGKVFSFDIQKIAILNTKEKLNLSSFQNNACIILDSHENMDKYVDNNIKAVMFNLGYMPGGDHKVSTTYEKSIPAIKKALSLLCKNGIITIVIYSGGNTGFDEKNKVLDFLEKIDYTKYTTTLHSYINRPNNPPMVAVIEKIN
jgi:tRNA G37 N-methylase Trm5